MINQKRRYLLDLIGGLEQQVRMVSEEMIDSKNEDLVRHGKELMGAASIMKTWIEGLEGGKNELR